MRGTMQADTEGLRRHFMELSDEGLLDIDRGDLTELAQQCYDAEIAGRGLTHEPLMESEQGDDELVLLATFLSPTEADLAAALLRSANIPANLENEHSSEWTGAGGLRLMVPASLLEEAQEILKSQISEDELIAHAEAAELIDPDVGDSRD